MFTGNSATRAARDRWEAPALCSRETVPPVLLGTGGRRPRCVHGKQCHPCRSGPVGGARVVFTGNSATRAARDRWEAPALCSRETVPPVPLGTGGRRPRCVHGKQCHPCCLGPVGGARVVFTGNSATRAARDLWEASRLLNARVTTKTNNPSISSPSWNLWRESSWYI